MSDLRGRIPGQALMEKLATMRGTPDVVELPLGIVKVSPEALNWVRGIHGEHAMARQLARLGDEWTVLHSIPVGERGSDIDHLVVGPTGVFPINAKRLVGKAVWAKGRGFLVNGQRSDYLRNSAFEAQRVHGVLRSAGLAVEVVPVIAISGAASLTVDAPSWNGRAIDVVAVERAVRRIRKRPVALLASEIEQVVSVVSSPTVWSRNPVSDASDDVLTTFRLVDRGIDRWNALMLLAKFAVVGTGILIVVEVGRALLGV